MFMHMGVCTFCSFPTSEYSLNIVCDYFDRIIHIAAIFGFIGRPNI